MQAIKINSIPLVVALSAALIIGVELLVWKFWILPIQQQCDQYVETTCQVIYSNYTTGIGLKYECDSNNNCANLPYNFAQITTIWSIAPNIFNYSVYYNADFPFVSLLGGIKQCWYVPDNPQNTLSFDQSKCETDLVNPVIVGVFVPILIIMDASFSISRIYYQQKQQRPKVRQVAQRTIIIPIKTYDNSEPIISSVPPVGKISLTITGVSIEITNKSQESFTETIDSPPGGPQIG